MTDDIIDLIIADKFCLPSIASVGYTEDSI